MKVIRHYCPYSTDDFFQISSGPEIGTVSIDRVKGEDYYIEVYDKNGKIIISCNYPVTMHTRTIELGKYMEDEYMLRVSRMDGEGVCIYIVRREE
jgi:hypothetical protein